MLQLDKLYNRVVFGEVFENDEIEPAKSIPPTTVIPEEIEDVSPIEEIQQSSDRLEWSEDLKRERFRLLSLLTKTVQRKSPIFAASYSGNILEADIEEDENTHFEEEAIFSEDEIKRKVYRFLFGLFIMFCSFTGFMSDNYTFSFISFCFGIFLLLPPLKKLKNDYKRDKSGKYNLLLAFVSLAISFSVENKVVHNLFFCLAGGILFFFFKKKLEKISKNIERFFLSFGLKARQLKVCKNYNYTRYHFLRRLRSVSLLASSSPTKTSFLGSHVSSRRKLIANIAKLAEGGGPVTCLCVSQW